MVFICREFGWTYYEYMSQPTPFVEAIKDFIRRENKARMDELRKQKAQSRR